MRTEIARPWGRSTGPADTTVARAHGQVLGRVCIDMSAGRSEVLHIAAGAQEPEWLALDLLAQAEHDADAQSILITPDKALAEAVVAEVERLLPRLPRAAVALSLIQNSRCRRS